MPSELGLLFLTLALAAPASNQLPETTTACCSQPPDGYYKTDDSLSPTSCGSPREPTGNVCTYQRYDNKPIGTMLLICSGQPLAPGWLQIATSWDPNSCGRPDESTQNVQTVRRFK
jgi:hypothetical protein